MQPIDMSGDFGSSLIVIFIAVTLFQFLLAIYMAFSLRLAARERNELHKEMYGLLRKLEGLTATRREQMLKHYDKILESLSIRLPPTIAAQASATIFETESKILARLAELEPHAIKDDTSRRKMDELIKSMENLEQTIVALTAETVRKVMVDSRRNFIEEDDSRDVSLAA